MENYEVSILVGERKHGKKERRVFNVNHNLKDYGLSIEAAFDNGLARTETYSVQDFCDYVVSKDPVNLVCQPLK